MPFRFCGEGGHDPGQIQADIKSPSAKRAISSYTLQVQGIAQKKMKKQKLEQNVQYEICDTHL